LLLNEKRIPVMANAALQTSRFGFQKIGAEQGFESGDYDFMLDTVDALLGGPASKFWFVNQATGSDSAGGTSAHPFATVQRAVDAATANGATGWQIIVSPGSYDETVTIARPIFGSYAGQIVGAGPKGSVAIAPSTTDAGAIINHADDMALINIGAAANGTGMAILNTGARFNYVGGKFENDDGTGLCVRMTLGTVAQRAAHTHGGGADCSLLACEFAWAASGLQLMGTDYGAVTELRVEGCYFHDLATSHILEAVGSGGSAAVMFNSLLLRNNVHGRDEAGSEPTNYILLNGDNANSGLVAGCQFPTALAGGLNLVSTKLIWAGNLHTGGISTGQPR
jgi:hypothetical protein